MRPRSFFVLSSLLLAVTVVNACAGSVASKNDARTMDAFREEPLPAATTFSGSYLAGQFAQRQKDWNAAQNYLGAVLDEDSGNGTLRHRTFLLSIGAGNYAQAAKLARELLAKEDSADGLSLVFLACEALSRDDFTAALAWLEKLPDDDFGQYTKPLLTTWTLVGMGKKAEGLALLSKYADDADPTYQMHAGMIEELTGDTEAAAAHYTKAMAGGLTMHTAVLIGNFFQRTGKPEMAKMIFDGLGELYPFNPFISSAAADARTAPPGITRAAEGAGFVLFDLATLLFEKHAYDSAQIYGGVMRLLVPELPFGLLMAGDLAALYGQHGKAITLYDAIPRSSPLFWLSRMRVSEVYETSGHLDMALALLQDLAKQKPTRVNALVAMGDIHRRHENFAGAVQDYDAALASLGKLTETHWPIIYARGMALERLNNWQRAEKDLLQALEFQPDNPMILNFIGYSWANKGLHLDKALDYIKRAVALRPQDGYILDSYGWALYRAGHFAESVEWMERAISYVPDDETILDHLGDVYWQAGRVNEARFKWRRAHELSTDEAFKNLLKAKLHNGIPRQPDTRAAQKEAKL